MHEFMKNIQIYTLDFVQGYQFKVPMHIILGNEMPQIKVLYKSDYFNPKSEFYKKGIGDIVINFKSGYTIIIKETVGRSWGFALLDKPHYVAEEVWELSEKQKDCIPLLRDSLEKGYPYRNHYGNLTVEV